MSGGEVRKMMKKKDGGICEVIFFWGGENGL